MEDTRLNTTPSPHLTEANRKALEDMVPELLELVKSSDQTFEKQISYIAGGGIALSFILVEKLVGDVRNSMWPLVLFIGLLGLAGCLIVNLWSQKIASEAHSANLDEIRYSLRLKPDEQRGQGFYNTERCKNRRSKIIKWNKSSIRLLLGGLLLIVVYISVNLW